MRRREVAPCWQACMHECVRACMRARMHASPTRCTIATIRGGTSGPSTAPVKRATPLQPSFERCTTTCTSYPLHSPRRQHQRPWQAAAGGSAAARGHGMRGHAWPAHSHARAATGAWMKGMARVGGGRGRVGPPQQANTLVGDAQVHAHHLGTNTHVRALHSRVCARKCTRSRHTR